MTDFYKDGYFYRKPGHEWEKDLYGEDVNGKGDLFPNTCRKIADDKDKSEWARRSLLYTRIFLKQGLRWPNRMWQKIDANTRIRWRWSQLCKWLYLVSKVKYRSQNSITRDPWIYFIVACVVTGNERYMDDIKPPWYLFNPGVWTWRRYLITGKGLWLYYFLTLNYPKLDYTIRLRKYMDMAVEIKTQTI